MHRYAHDYWFNFYKLISDSNQLFFHFVTYGVTWAHRLDFACKMKIKGSNPASCHMLMCPCGRFLMSYLPVGKCDSSIKCFVWLT